MGVWNLPTAAILTCAIAVQTPAPATTDVPVSVVILDAANKPVTGLTAADFEAFIDAASVPITSVTPRGPLSLAVVVDTTRSTGWGRTGTIKGPQNEVLAALTSLRDDDQVLFGSFGPRIRFDGEWRLRRGRNLAAEVEKAFKADADETHGPSPIWDVIYDTVQMLAAEPPPRAMLLLTDGRSTRKLTQPQPRRRLRRRSRRRHPQHRPLLRNADSARGRSGGRDPAMDCARAPGDFFRRHRRRVQDARGPSRAGTVGTAWMGDAGQLRRAHCATRRRRLAPP